MQRLNHRLHLDRIHKKLGSSPLIMWFLGALVLLLWAAGTIVQIQTSEYLAMGSSVRVAGVAWNVFMQPWLMLTGQAPIQYVTSCLYGWVVVVINLVFALAMSAAGVNINSVNAY